MDRGEHTTETWLHQQGERAEREARRHQDLVTKYREQTRHQEELIRVQEKANELFRKSVAGQQEQHALLMEAVSAHETRLIALERRIQAIEQGLLTETLAQSRFSATTPPETGPPTRPRT